MGAFRIPYALAYGKYGNFQARTDNLFASTDATPNISQGYLFWTNNASATSITYFDGATNGLINPEEGQEIKVICLDNNTTFVNSNQLRLREGANIPAPTGSSWDFIYHNSTWFETYRSYNTAGVLALESANVAAGGVITINPAVTAVTLLTGASSAMNIQRMDGGYTGQLVTVIGIGSSVTLTTNSAGANDTFVVKTVAGTTAIITGSFGIAFARVLQGATAKWIQVAED